MLSIPKNVMQIGQSNPHCKIYVEDYVHTFLKQRKKEEIYLAFGKKEEVDGVLYYLIYGAEKKTDWDRGSLPYFKKYDRLGTLEGTAEKRVFRPLRQEAMPLDGYFVFYEQNEDMQSYMITVREKEDLQREKETEKEAVLDAVRVHREAAASRTQEKKETKEMRGRARGKQEVRRQRKFLRLKSAPAFSVNKGITDKKVWTIPQICRVASLGLVLILAVAGVTSINGYTGLKSAGDFLGETIRNLRAAGEKETAVTLNDVQHNFIIEETQLSESLGATESVGGQTEVQTGAQTDGRAGEQADAQTEGQAVAKADEQMNGQTEVQDAESDSRIQWTVGQPSSADEAAPAASESTQAQAAQGESEQEEIVHAEVQPEAAPAENSETIQPEVNSEETVIETLSRPESYVVKRGDSLAEICRRFYGDTSRLYEICSLNKIENPDQIRYGQNILLP